MNPIAFLLSEHSEFLGQNQRRVGCHGSVLSTIPSTENKEGRSMVGRDPLQGGQISAFPLEGKSPAYPEAWGWGLGGREPLELPSFLLYRGLIFIKTPGILVLLGACGMPPKGMYLAVIPVI